MTEATGDFNPFVYMQGCCLTVVPGNSNPGLPYIVDNNSIKEKLSVKTLWGKLMRNHIGIYLEDENFTNNCTNQA